jgi:2-polyprenyl-6-methoxyphenol hydroxylase-like FAD-dependent oxidoreductase
MRSALVSGSSIAGPTVAYWLAKSGFDVTVVERASAFRAGGQAIDIRGPALTVIREMGLLDQILARRTRLKGMSMLDIDGKEISRSEERTISAGRLNSGDVEILRDDLASLLFKATQPDVDYRFGDSIATMMQDQEGVVVTFESGESQLFDLVIGADGLHSNTRHLGRRSAP